MGSKKSPAIENAEEVIERFGGIRPMASKINVPVTTVQGWKKRNVIPGTRREDILNAAYELNIDITDVVSEDDIANQNGGDDPYKAIEAKAKREARQQATHKPKAQPQSEQDKNNQNAPEESSASQDKGNQQKPEVNERQSVVEKTQKREKSMNKAATKSKSKNSDDQILRALEENNKKTIVTTAWVVTGLLLLAAAVITFFLWPSAQKIEQQQQTLNELQNKVDDVDQKTSLISGLVPENLKESLNDIKDRAEGDLQALQNQAKNTQIALEQLKDKTAAISEDVLGADAGPLSQRLAVIEQQLANLNGGEGGQFAGLINRIQKLEETVPGQMQFQDSINELKGIVNGLDGQVNTLEGRLEEAQNSDGALGQTLEGVNGNDLKAAAMLIAFSQMRDSLNREDSFDEDLVLLYKMTGEDNIELRQSLEKLAPHAQQGVLSRQGLSREFRGLAGEIVVSSLKGEDISIRERAKARLNDVMTIEKDGELLTGTDTQATVAKAQALLDQGDIQGAMAELQSLEGGAAETAQPFMQQLQATLQAEETQQLLRNSILSKVTGQIQNLGGGNPLQSIQQSIPAMPTQALPSQVLPEGTNGFDMNEIKKTLEENVTQPDVVKDEESGFTILPKQQGFKGFSAGQ